MTSPGWNRSRMGTGSGTHIRRELLSSSSIMQPKARFVIHCVRVLVSRNPCVCVRARAFLRLDVTSLPRSIAINAKKGKNFARQTEVGYFISKGTKSGNPCTVTRANNYSFSPASSQGQRRFTPARLSFYSIFSHDLHVHASLASAFPSPSLCTRVNFTNSTIERIDDFNQSMFLIIFFFFSKNRCDFNYLRWWTSREE